MEWIPPGILFEVNFYNPLRILWLIRFFCAQDLYDVDDDEHNNSNKMQDSYVQFHTQRDVIVSTVASMLFVIRIPAVQQRRHADVVVSTSENDDTS